MPSQTSKARSSLPTIVIKTRGKQETVPRVYVSFDISFILVNPFQTLPAGSRDALTSMPMAATIQVASIMSINATASTGQSTQSIIAQLTRPTRPSGWARTTGRWNQRKFPFLSIQTNNQSLEQSTIWPVKWNLKPIAILIVYFTH